MKTQLALLLASVAFIPNALAISVGPSVQVTVDGQSQILTPRQDPDKKTWSFGPEGQTIGGQELGYAIQITGTFDPDPSIAYGLAVTDFGAPSTFGFVFFTPIVPTGPATLVDASISGAFTDLTGDGVSATPVLPNTTIQQSAVSFPTTSMGVDVGPGFSAGAGAPGAFYVYGPYASGPIAGPAGGPWTGLTIANSFTLSGGGDIAVFTGFSQVVNAPVPDAGVGLAGLLAMLAVPAVARYSRK